MKWEETVWCHWQSAWPALLSLPKEWCHQHVWEWQKGPEVISFIYIVLGLHMKIYIRRLSLFISDKYSIVRTLFFIVSVVYFFRSSSLCSAQPQHPHLQKTKFHTCRKKDMDNLKCCCCREALQQKRIWHFRLLSSILLPQSYRTIYLEDTASGNSAFLMYRLVQNASYHSRQKAELSLRHWLQYNCSSSIRIYFWIMSLKHQHVTSFDFGYSLDLISHLRFL